MGASRTSSILDLAYWLILCSLWWVGGYFLAKYLFRLRSRELIFSGCAIGMLLFIVLSNLLAHFLELEASYWISAALLFTAGFISSKGQVSVSNRSTKGLFSQIGRSSHLYYYLHFLHASTQGFRYSMIIIICRWFTAGIRGFPSSFLLKPEQRLDYHYGLHLFAASLVQVGGFYPWSAWILPKRSA